MTSGLTAGAPSGAGASSTSSTSPAAPAQGDACSSHAQNPFARLLAGAVSATVPVPVPVPAASLAGSTLPTTMEPTLEEASHDDDLPDQILSLIGGDPWPPAPPALPSTGHNDTPVVVPGELATQAELLVAALPADPSAAPTVNSSSPSSNINPSLPLAPAQGPVIADTPDSVAVPFGEAVGTDIRPTKSTDAAGTDTGDFILPGQQILASHASRTTTPATVATPIAMPADPDAGFDDAFGARIGWMADQRIGHAQIRVSPDHAGPIDIRLHLDGTRVSAEFVSTNADVRQTLEASIGRLRDMLDQQGLQLTHTDVGSRQSNSSGDRASSDATATSLSSDADGDSDEFVGDLPEPALMRRGLLDEYA